MRLNAPPISELRLQRYHRWMLLWLKWFAAFLSQAGAFAPLSRQAQALAHHWLDKVERVLVNILIIRAKAHVRPAKAAKHHPWRRKERHVRRAIIGARLRRTLRREGLSDRIAALSQNIEGLVARLARRLPRGLTRRRPAIPRREARALSRADAPFAASACADTS